MEKYTVIAFVDEVKVYNGILTSQDLVAASAEFLRTCIDLSFDFDADETNKESDAVSIYAYPNETYAKVFGRKKRRFLIVNEKDVEKAIGNKTL